MHSYSSPKTINVSTHKVQHFFFVRMSHSTHPVGIQQAPYPPPPSRNVYQVRRIRNMHTYIKKSPPAGRQGAAAPKPLDNEIAARAVNGLQTVRDEGGTKTKVNCLRGRERAGASFLRSRAYRETRSCLGGFPKTEALARMHQQHNSRTLNLVIIEVPANK